ncbi:MAG: alpha/beta fold hydrolase [bacterium]
MITRAARIAAAAGLLLCACSPARAKSPFLAFYDYDAGAPLNAFAGKIKSPPQVVRYRVAFDSVNGERVPAVLQTPSRGAGPHPCVIAQHGYTMSKSQMIMLMHSLTESGYALFAIDAQYHGDRAEPGKNIFSKDVELDIEALRQTVIDLRRGIDFLETRREIDASRITYVGVSMGGILGSILSGVDERVKAPVLVDAGGGWRTLIANSRIAPAVALRRDFENGGATLEAFADRAKFIEPLNYVWRISPRPVLFINGKEDLYVPAESIKLLHEAAAEPVEIVWFDSVEGDPTGHIPPFDEVKRHCLRWWEAHL